MNGPMRAARAARRSCLIHGDNGCDIQGEAGPVTRALEKRRWRAEVAGEHERSTQDAAV